MNLKECFLKAFYLMALTVAFASCSDDNDMPDSPGGDEPVIDLPHVRTFILNQGTWGYNNAGIAFYAPNGDAPFRNDIFLLQNGVALGDTGQDMIEYDDFIYVSVNVSNYLVKLDNAGVEQARISFANDPDLSAGIRYLAADEGYIYASFWGGMVAKINAETLQVEAKLGNVGGNLEGLAICNGVLYVENSHNQEGGSFTYNTEVAMIDLASFVKTGVLEVVQNPNKRMLEEDGKIFLISDDYTAGVSVLQMIDTAHGNKVTVLGNATGMCEDDGMLYLANSQTDYTTNPATTVTTFSCYDIQRGIFTPLDYVSEAPELASSIIYMIEVNEDNGDVYVGVSHYADSNGDIYRFRKDGTLIEKFDCGGQSPVAAVFID